VLILALLAWILASGPAIGSLLERGRSLHLMRAGFTARVALDWSLAELRNLIVVRPAVDPETVREDEREAFDESAPATVPSEAKPTTISAPKGPAVQSSPKLDQSTNSYALGSLPSSSNPQGTGADDATRALARQSISASQDIVSIPASLPPAAVAGNSRSDLTFSVAEAEKSLTRASENAPKLAAVAPGLPSVFGDPSRTREEKSLELGRAVPVVLPSRAQDRPYEPVQPGVVLGFGSEPQLTSAQPAPLSSTAPPAPTAAAPAITLKALGYARSAAGAQAILTDGITLYVVNEGEEFADRFRVTAIRPEGLDIEDRLTNAAFQLMFGH
jgi:hypothetical protein